jgi:hypothetical protein
MDVRMYYQKLRQVEASIEDAWVVVVSEETPDGGRAGVMNEVSRNAAAAMVVEGRARLAMPGEVAQYRAQMQRAKSAAEEAELSNRIQVTVLSEQELRGLKSLKPSKG